MNFNYFWAIGPNRENPQALAVSYDISGSGVPETNWQTYVSGDYVSDPISFVEKCNITTDCYSVDFTDTSGTTSQYNGPFFYNTVYPQYLNGQPVYTNNDGLYVYYHVDMYWVLGGTPGSPSGILTSTSSPPYGPDAEWKHGRGTTVDVTLQCNQATVAGV